jgi:choline dehydrogenase-like flavoprotein
VETTLVPTQRGRHEQHAGPDDRSELGAEVGHAGLGRLLLLIDEDEESWPDDLSGGYHLMGTTRMSADPRTGVVDADCRVHGMDNLYVAGSSVFADGGSGTPTLTIVALALRLADHLKMRLGDGA